MRVTRVLLLKVITITQRIRKEEEEEKKMNAKPSDICFKDS